MKAWLRHTRPLVLATAASVFFAACDEQLDSGLACPALCPQQQASLRDTVLFALEMDTSIAGYPPIGTEQRLVITSMGDTLQTRGIIRYDTLPTTFRHINTADDSAIVFVDTGSHVALRLVTGDTTGEPVTVEVYDVDMGGAEEADLSVLAGAFTPSRLIGSRTVPADSLRDSVKVPIDPNVILAKIQAPPPENRLRIGIRVTSSGSPTLTVVASNSSSPIAPPLLVFRPSADTTVQLVTLGPRSKTPEETFIAADLADFLLVTRAPPDAPPDVIRVGGLPARRAYLRFNVPSDILDSSSVVRATLQLTQRPNADSPEAQDSVAIQPFEVTASAAIEDISRALLFIRARPATTDSLRLIAAGSGERELEIVGIVRDWRFTDPDKAPRAVALRATSEGLSGRQVDFYSIEAPPALRPRLRISYLPKPAGGLP